MSDSAPRADHRKGAEQLRSDLAALGGLLGSDLVAGRAGRILEDLERCADELEAAAVQQADTNLALMRAHDEFCPDCRAVVDAAIAEVR